MIGDFVGLWAVGRWWTADLEAASSWGEETRAGCRVVGGDVIRVDVAPARWGRPLTGLHGVRVDVSAAGAASPTIADMNQHLHHLSTMTAGTRRRLALAAPILAGLAVVPSYAAAAAPSSRAGCGATITSDVRLDADLIDCPGNGLVIGASGITIDLGGHTIDGTGDGFGIENPGGYDDVAIRRGTITGFAIGVVVFDTTAGTVERITATGNLEGFAVQRAVDVELDRVAAVDNVANGISVSFSDGTIVRRATVTGNGQGGIVDRASTASRYERNHVSANAFGIEISQTEAAQLERNVASGNDGDGIRIGFDATGVQLDRNRTDANADNGLVVEEPGNAVSRHRASGNGASDIILP